MPAAMEATVLNTFVLMIICFSCYIRSTPLEWSPAWWPLQESEPFRLSIDPPVKIVIIKGKSPIPNQSVVLVPAGGSVHFSEAVHVRTAKFTGGPPDATRKTCVFHKDNKGPTAGTGFEANELQRDVKGVTGISCDVDGFED